MLNSLLVKSIIKKDIESGEITVDTSKKMDKENPSGTGSFSMNRKARTEIGLRSVAEGFHCEASGADSHAEGGYTTASGTSSHAEGNTCRATAQASHAEGETTTASGYGSHSEGDTTTASGNYSHAEGASTKASGPNSHAEGVHTEASGYYSHAEGLQTKASGTCSHSGGNGTIAGYKSQTAIGEYNDNKEEDIFEVGNGTSNKSRSNALELTKTGDLKIGGSYIDGSGNTLSMDSANEYTDQKIADLINGAPTTLDTLKEIADAMEESQGVVDALDKAIGTKANSSDLTDHIGNTNNPHNVTAELTPYDNTTSGLSAQNVQDAVDEVSSNLEQLEYSDVAGGKNLFNKNTVLFGYGLHAQTGNAEQSANLNCSDYIKVEPNTTYTRSESGSTTTIVYDSSKKYISELGNFLTFTIPSNGAYVRFNIKGDYLNNYSDIQFVKGTTTTQNVPYIMSNKQITEEINEQNANLDEIDEKVGQNGCGEVSGGKNLINILNTPTHSYNGITITKSENCLILSGTSTDVVDIYLADSNDNEETIDNINSEYGAYVLSNNLGLINYFTTTSSYLTNKVTTSESNKVSFIFCRIESGKTFNNDVLEVQLEKGSTATPYEPYFPSNKMLAEENEQQNIEAIDLKMLGWTVPKECPIKNEVNGNQFIQKVGRVDLGKSDYVYQSSFPRFYTIEHIPNSILKDEWNTNIYSEGYLVYPVDYNSIDKSMCMYGGLVYFKDTRYTDATSFKTAMQGQYLYYKLATPITTTIDGNEIGETVSDVRKETTVNLLKPTLETTTVNGVTCTNNGDGTYTLNGTATSDLEFRFNNYLPPYGIYKLLGAITAYQRTSSGNWIKTISTGETFTVDSSKPRLEVVYFIHKDEVFNNVVIKPMVTTNLDAVESDFVPFTGTTGKLNGDVAELEKSNENKMDKENPTGTGAFSMNRKANTTVGENSTTEGSDCTASGNYSHAEGLETNATQERAHAEGYGTNASGYQAHTEGHWTVASGQSSHAEGESTLAQGYETHAEGNGTKAIGNFCHVEGHNTTALSDASHSEGSSTNRAPDSITSSSTNDDIISSWNSSKFSLAKGAHSHVEGCDCLALGDGSHAEGARTKAVGDMSHSGGCATEATGRSSCAIGEMVSARYDYQTAIGILNHNKEENIFEVGNGISDSTGIEKSNALELTRIGDLTIQGDYIFTDENGNKISMRNILTRLAALEQSSGFSVDVEE